MDPRKNREDEVEGRMEKMKKKKKRKKKKKKKVK